MLLQALCCLMWYHFYTICFFFLERKQASIFYKPQHLKGPHPHPSFLPPDLCFLRTWEPRCRGQVFATLKVWPMDQKHWHAQNLLEMQKLCTHYRLTENNSSSHKIPSDSQACTRLKSPGLKHSLSKKKFFLVVLISVPPVHLLISTLYLHPTPLSSSPDIESAPSWHRYSPCK